MKIKIFVARLIFSDLDDDCNYNFYGSTPLKAVEAAIKTYREICSDKYEKFGLNKPYVFDQGVIEMMASAIIPDIKDGVIIERKRESHGFTVWIDVWRDYMHS
jgi:hypothetical protein